MVDDSIHTNSSSTANSHDPTQDVNVTISAAVAYGKYNHNSTATIGRVSRSTQRIFGVAATRSCRTPTPWLVGDSLGTVLTTLTAASGS